MAGNNGEITQQTLSSNEQKLCVMEIFPSKVTAIKRAGRVDLKIGQNKKKVRLCSTCTKQQELVYMT